MACAEENIATLTNQGSPAVALLMMRNEHPASFHDVSEKLRTTLGYFSHVASININDVHCDEPSKLLSPECIARWKEIHETVCIYTVNNAKRAYWLVEHGVSGLFSDDLDIVLALNS